MKNRIRAYLDDSRMPIEAREAIRRHDQRHSEAGLELLSQHPGTEITVWDFQNPHPMDPTVVWINTGIFVGPICVMVINSRKATPQELI